MKLKTTETCLPKIVQKTVGEMYEFLNKKDNKGLSFFDEAEMHDKKICIWVLEDVMGPICIKNWIKRGEPTLTRKQAEVILEQIPILYTFHTLKRKGLMDSMENEKGEEIFFLSERGKIFGELLKQKEIEK